MQPEQVTDIVISHAHWDHLGGIDLFPKATVWIQKEEFRYYTGEAWQPGGNHGGIDPEDVQALVRINTEDRLRLIDGDDVEIFPGIRAYTGGAAHLRVTISTDRRHPALRSRLRQYLPLPEYGNAHGQ